MTKSEVRQLFGEAEKISVIEDSEFWDYGRGSMTFTVNADHPDGWLYEWFEPSATNEDNHDWEIGGWPRGWNLGAASLWFPRVRFLTFPSLDVGPSYQFRD
jgi:hypothetical protein